MTTKEYVKKYNLDKSSKFSHNGFVQDMRQELLALCEINKALDNLKGFDNALRCVKMKWDAIANKTLGVFPEKLWGYFFATVVAPLKKELCPREVEAKAQLNAEKKRQWEERRRWDDEYFNSTYERLWSRLLIASIQQTPLQEFKLLGIANIEHITVDDIRTKYRELSKIHHPDKGGKQELFVQLTEAKNKCIAWLDNRVA
jgi:hypothetical protein